MTKSEILIPEGWTYFTYRTNTQNWNNSAFNPFSDYSIYVSRSKVMSAITERDVYREIERNGRNSKIAYTGGIGKPLEIRCLICDLNYLNNLQGHDDIKNIMLNEFYFDKNNDGGMRGHRHPSIPRNEQLLVMAFGKYDETYEQDRRIVWTIPNRFLGFYNEEIKKNKNRIMPLKSPHEMDIEKVEKLLKTTITPYIYGYYGNDIVKLEHKDIQMLQIEKNKILMKLNHLFISGELHFEGGKNEYEKLKKAVQEEYDSIIKNYKNNSTTSNKSSSGTGEYEKTEEDLPYGKSKPKDKSNELKNEEEDNQKEMTEKEKKRIKDIEELNRLKEEAEKVKKQMIEDKFEEDNGMTL